MEVGLGQERNEEDNETNQKSCVKSLVKRNWYGTTARARHTREMGEKTRKGEKLWDYG